jgi:hypothetical protein
MLIGEDPSIKVVLADIIAKSCFQPFTTLLSGYYKMAAVFITMGYNNKAEVDWLLPTFIIGELKIKVTSSSALLQFFPMLLTHVV